MADPIADRQRRRRHHWIVALALPGYVALAGFALMAGLQSAHLEPPDLIAFLIGLTTVACWGFGPFFVPIDIVVLLRDPWRRERPRGERIRLRLLVLGSPFAWLASNLIVDAYHFLR